MQTAKAEDVVFQAELENGLRLSLSDNDVMLVVKPLTMQFVSDSMTATVATNNPYGYSLTAYSGGQVN